MDQPTVLIISEDAQFSRAISNRWQEDRNTPVFTVMRADLCHVVDPSDFDLAIVGGLDAARWPTVLKALSPAGKTVLAVPEEPFTEQSLREHHARALFLRRREGWLDALFLIVSEVLRRTEATRRARNAERTTAALEREATLGRYMLEMRHTLNNALTSVLGNSELLLLEPGTLAGPQRSQVETIRNMATRMHEILQRLSSLDAELKLLERQNENERQRQARAAAAS
jgi:signal transduction histidine kinase